MFGELSVGEWLLSKLPQIIFISAIIGALAFGGYKLREDGYNAAIADMAKATQKHDAENKAKVDTLQAQIDKDTEMYAQSVRDASNQELAWQAKYNKAVNDAKISQQQRQADSIKLSAVRNSLLDTTSTAISRAELPTTTDNARTEYIVALTTAFNDCTTKYSALSIDATGYVIDERGLIASWPTANSSTDFSGTTSQAVGQNDQVSSSP